MLLLPPLGAADPESQILEPYPTNAQASAERLVCGRVEARFTSQGEVAFLSIDAAAVPLAGPANALTLYPDYPHLFDAWDIDRQTLHLGETVTSAAKCEDWAPSQGVGVAFSRSLGEKSRVEIRYWVDPAYPVLQVELVLDWHEQDALLKALFPTEYQGRHARFGTPFNSVLRSQQPGNPQDEAMFESCASRWVTVMDDGQSEGLSLITEDKYGVACREGTIGLSLVRSVRVTGEEGGFAPPVLVPELREGGARNSYSDQGRHTIRYALGSWHAHLPREEQPAAQADLLYTPCVQGAMPSATGLQSLKGGESLVPAWCKPVGPGEWILRLHEVLGRSGSLKVECAEGWSISRTRLDEQVEDGPDGTVAFRAYEIVSLRLKKLSMD
jgi:alpha-mannosidase